MIKRIAILTSGGDAPGMNAAIRSITRTAINRGLEVFGIYDGYKGLVEDRLELFDTKSVSETLFKGGTILGTARLPEFKEEDYQQKAIETLKKHQIDVLCVIGGDGSYRGALALHKLGVNVVGLPGTIDNDLAGTDYTIGFHTALETVVECIDKLRDTSSSHHRCSVVEVMGNRCGDLALYSGLATGAEIVVTADRPLDLPALYEKLNYYNAHKKNHASVVVNEKITDVSHLAELISENTGFSGRASVLGHIQRGGSPCPFDRILASRMGNKAVEILMNGDSGKCVCIQDDHIIALPIETVLTMPKENKSRLYELFDSLV